MTIDETMALEALEIKVLKGDLRSELGLISRDVVAGLKDVKNRIELDQIWINISELEKKSNAPSKAEWSDLFFDIAADFILGKFIKLITTSSRAFVTHLAKKKGFLTKELAKPDVGEELANFLLGESGLEPYVGFKSQVKGLLKKDDDHGFLEEFLGEVLDNSFKKVRADIKISLKDTNSNVAKATKNQLENIDAYIFSIALKIQTLFKGLKQMVEDTDSIFWLTIVSIPIRVISDDHVTNTCLYKIGFHKIIRDYIEGVLFVGMVHEKGSFQLDRDARGYFLRFENSYGDLRGVDAVTNWTRKPINEHKIVTRMVVGGFKVLPPEIYDNALKHLYSRLPPGEESWSVSHRGRRPRILYARGTYAIEFDALRFDFFGKELVGLFLRLRFKFNDKSLPCGSYCYAHVLLSLITPNVAKMALEKSKQIFVIDKKTGFLNDVYAINGVGATRYVPATYTPSKL